MTLGMTRNRPLALLAAIACMFAMAASVMAYGPQVPTLVTVTPSSLTFLCGHPEAVDATVLDQDGLPIKGAIVSWSFTSSPSSQDRFLQATSKTNKDGVAKTMVKLACVAGDRSITATTGGVSGSAVVHVDLGHPGQGAEHSASWGAAVALGAAALGAAMWARLR
jgi:Bacterial Ig-like domain (group 1)